MHDHDNVVRNTLTCSRRTLLRYALAAPAALALSKVAFDIPAAQAAPPAPKGPFKLPPLPYAYSALSRSIDTTTMRLHHDKHHQAYVDKLNEAVGKEPALVSKTPQTMIMDLSAVPSSVREAVRNNAGGHVNHSMFWQIMSPQGGGAPRGEIATAIKQGFGSFEDFKTKFDEAGVKRFGSGWVWLVSDKGTMKIISTPNQDNPLSMGMFPILGNDVWEHAYYLKYQNKRADYLKAWWNIVNWDAINARIRYMKSV